MLSTIFTVIVAVIILLLIIAALSPKDSTIVSETLINRPKNVVFNYVKLLKNQEKYSTWVMQDPNIKLTYTGIDGTVGFKAAWTSDVKNVGVGEQEITSIVENGGYDAEIRFEKPFKGVSTSNVTLVGVSDNQTRVTTTFKSSTPFPMNIMIPMIKKMLQKDMDGNGERLKNILENQ